MGKNWLHIQDGSGQAGSNDLTVNTNSVAKVGDTVIISGKLTVAKDFGYGYQYDVIVEDAKITKE
jgi:sporulation protein YlmC with PRC-barrel domain